MWKYLIRSNKWTLSLIIFFIAIAFINMIFVTSLFNGIIEGFNEQIIDTSTGHILVTPAHGEDVIKNAPNILAKIESIAGIEAASAEVIVPGSIQYGNTKGSWQILAIDPERERTVTNVAAKMIEGNYLDAGDAGGIIIGSSIADSDAAEGAANPFAFSGINVGDTVTVLFGSSGYELTVRGIFKTKFIDTDDKAFITLDALKAMNPLYDNEATKIIVRAEKTGSEAELISSLKANGIKQNVYSWTEASTLMESISDSFLGINVILSIVGVLIAAITVFIVIYIDISSKRKQIGILRAIGIKPYLIQAMYVILTAVYSVAGVIIGSAIFFGAIIPYFNAHPFVLPIADATLMVNPGDFIARLETLIWVAIGAGLIPAIHITRIKLLDAIWGR